MRVPHFLRLARIDGQHFITACRHGLVDLTWGRTTTRFSRDEFRRLVGLLARAMDSVPPISLRDGELRVTFRPDEDCELRVASLVLLLSTAEFEEFAQMAQDALRRLDKVLDSGVWDQDEPEADPPSLLDQLRQIPFSRN